MSLGAIIIGTGLLILAIPFVAKPLFSKKGKKPGAVIKSELVPPDQNQYEETLVALRDLDFDHRTGKLTEEDYTNLRADLVVKAASELDAKKLHDHEVNSRLEAAIQARRQAKPVTQTCSKCGSSQSATDKFCSVCGASLEDSVCPNCGKRIQPNNLYCPGCGHRIVSQAISEVETAQ
jgi:rRNA maturation endonuclease Nob1